MANETTYKRILTVVVDEAIDHPDTYAVDDTMDDAAYVLQKMASAFMCTVRDETFIDGERIALAVDGFPDAVCVTQLEFDWMVEHGQLNAPQAH